MNKNEILDEIETLKALYLKIRSEIVNKLDSSERDFLTTPQYNENIIIYFNEACQIFNRLEDKLERDAEDKSHSVIEIERNRELIKDIKHTFDKLKESYDSNIKNLKPTPVK